MQTHTKEHRKVEDTNWIFRVWNNAEGSEETELHGGTRNSTQKL